MIESKVFLLSEERVDKREGSVTISSTRGSDRNAFYKEGKNRLPHERKRIA